MTFPFDHYWAAEDGRVFSSARCATVAKDDAGYAAWCDANGCSGTVWPSDEAGAQTLAALDDVLRPYGLSTKGAVRSATGYALVMALTDDQRALYGSLKAWDQRRLSLRGSDHIPEDNPLIARAAAVLKTDPKAWFDAALNVAG